MRTVLICHEGASLDQIGLARWLHDWSELAGVIVLRERSGRGWQRVRRELRRIGWLRFLDVLAFRLYYRLFVAGADARWEAAECARLCERYAPLPESLPILVTHSPNSDEARAFLEQAQPDVILARCKTLLKPAIFQLATTGTFVMHPGMCPEYRNAHGCFWALANGRPDQVAMTLLRIDAGVDTGPVYGYYTYDFDPLRESHRVIQQRVVTENLPALAAKLQEIHAGTAVPIDTRGRHSAEWGQPWLTRYFKARRAGRATPSPAVTGSPGA